MSKTKGFAIPIALIVLILVGLALGGMLLYSGSQTRSLAMELRSWRARRNALSGLALASERLREGRWYGDGRLVGNLTHEDVGWDEADGSFFVVAEDIRAFVHDPGTLDGDRMQRLAVLDRIDVFSVGEYDGVRRVAYGRFIMSPSPDFRGTSTNGLTRGFRSDVLTETAATLKRMIRVTHIQQRGLSDVLSEDVRNRIREIVAEQSADFQENYGRLLRPDDVSAPSEGRMEHEQARSILARYWSDSSPDSGGGPRFLHDRMRDAVLEGTPVDARTEAPRQREIELELDPPSDRRAFAEACCRLTGTTIVDPNPVPLFAPPDAVDGLHRDRGQETPSSDYRRRVGSNPEAMVQYHVTWGGTFNAGAYGDEVFDEDGIRGQMDGELAANEGARNYLLWEGVWYVNIRVEGPEWVEKPYWLEDPVTGRRLLVDDVVGFYQKFYDEGDSAPVGGMVKNDFDLGNMVFPIPGPTDSGGGMSAGW